MRRLFASKRLKQAQTWLRCFAKHRLLAPEPARLCSTMEASLVSFPPTLQAAL